MVHANCNLFTNTFQNKGTLVMKGFLNVRERQTKIPAGEASSCSYCEQLGRPLSEGMATTQPQWNCQTLDHMSLDHSAVSPPSLKPF